MQAPRHLPLVILLLVAAGAAGFGVYQWLAPVTGPKPANGLPVAQAPVLAKPMTLAEALSDKLEGVTDGQGHTLNDWHGKVLLVNYWATWCAPCREEMPLLVQLQARYAAQGFQVVGIATDETAQKDVKDYLDKMVVNYPILMGDDSVDRMVAGFGGNLIGLPFTALLNRDGQVIKITAGALDPKEADAMVRRALGLFAPVPAGATGGTTGLAKAKFPAK